jgi:glutathione reductase (NADPH)
MAYDFDLLVIGAGPAGLSAAKRAAHYGAKVAIAERSHPGGTCVNRGCVPKKLMVYAADFANLIPDAVGYGWSKAETEFHWQRFISTMQQEVEKIQRSQLQALTQAGVHFFAHHASFLDAHTLEIGEQKVTAEKILIAVGGKPLKPAIAGIEHAVTSDDMFNLSELPQRIAIIGGGYIGVEFASILRGFGVEVTVMNHESCILEGFDEDLQMRVQNGLSDRGIHILCSTTAKEIQPIADGFCLMLEGECPEKITADLVLCATGRSPNLAGLGLENAGIEADKKAIVVDEHCRTSQPHIFAAGDCANQKQLTPVARAAGLAFADREFGNQSHMIANSYIPSAVCARPEAATVGLTETQAREEFGDLVQTFCTEFHPLFHKLSQSHEKTFFKLVVNRKTDRVLGIHIVGAHAAEMIQGFLPALKLGLTKQQINQTIGIHPSNAEELFDL